MLRELLNTFLVPDTYAHLARSGCYFLNPQHISGSDPSPTVCKQTKGRGQRPELGFAGTSLALLAGSSLVSGFIMQVPLPMQKSAFHLHS